MGTVKTVILIDPDMRERMRPALKRHGMTLSSYIRREMADFVEKYEREERAKIESPWALKEA